MGCHPRARRARRLAAAVVVAGACTAASPDGARRGEPAHHFSPTPVVTVTEPASGWREASCALPAEHLRRIRRGLATGRSPDVVVVPREPNFIGGPVATSHSGPWDYLQRVPLVLYGPGFVRAQGEIDVAREATVADIAPTLAELLGTDFPADRPGRALTGALLPRSRRNGTPRVIVTVVWDGGGWNVLDAWPDAWPVLRRLARSGTSVAGATVGSSPSVTPAVHTTIGTGAFPRDHGIVGIYFRGSGGGITPSFPGRSARLVRVPSLADIYDASVANRAEVAMVAFKSWHLGMIGRGAGVPGGDRDAGVIIDQSERLVAGRDYSVPRYLRSVPGLERDLRAVDLDDGEADGKWMGHAILDDPRARRDTPAWILYQTRLIRALVSEGGFGGDRVPDLIFTNFKQIDEAGHNWNMLSEETREAVRYSDAALGRITRFLDRAVGRNRWVVVVTADHGQAPDPDVSGAWPIAVAPLVDDLAAEFEAPVDVVAKTSPAGLWLNRDVMGAHGVTAAAAADFVVDYRLRDNVAGDVPAAYATRAAEPIFAAAFPSAAAGRVWACVKRGAQ